MKYDIITIGSATVDYFADSDSELIRIDTRDSHRELLAFPLGSKILIRDMNTSTGGGGTNSAVSFARLGFRTAWLGKLGQDPLADFIRSKLTAEQVDCLGPAAGNTGVSFVLNSIQKDRTILAYKGANNELQANELPAFNSPWIYLSSMLEKSWETISHFITGCDCRIAFNPSTYQAELGYEALSKVIARLEILVMNREEACKILGRPYTGKEDMVELISALNQVEGQTVVITDGGKGVWVKDGSSIHQGLPQEGLNIVETTGAGDAFASTFTAARIRSKSIVEAIDLGMSNAESVLQHRGAKEKLLSWDALLQKVTQQSRIIKQHQA